MPKFLDHHAKMPQMPPEHMAQMKTNVQGKKADKFGVTPLNVIMGTNGEAWCLSEAPNAEAVIKAHEAVGAKLSRSDIVEVNTLA
ncbi:MAG: DUF4242 domain-containing protein [Chloroflexi bacterium]|nr:DUF4242 domain-containing protein [Chloroflexota bacterium]